MLQLAMLRQNQTAIMRHPAKYKFICAGRRFGKTFMCIEIAMSVVANGGRVAWIVPTYKNARSMWRAIERKALRIPKSQITVKSKSERMLELSNFGSISVFSDANGNADSALGDAFHLVIIDEAARVDATTYYDVLMPTLADFDGDLIAISTPKGRNWFWDEWVKGQNDVDELSQSFQIASNANPLPGIQKAFRLAKERLPESSFRENWLAEFIDDAGLVFRNIANVCVLKPQKPYEGRFCFGVDWGRYNDYTVISVIDMDTKQQVYLDRFNRIGWDFQRQRIVNLYKQWQPEIIIAESNSIGEPNIEALQSDGLPVEPFQTTAKSKAPLIEALSLAIENDDIVLLDDRIQKAELLEFGMTRLPSGKWRYEAPQGKHDDTVIATALAWYGATQDDNELTITSHNWLGARDEQKKYYGIRRGYDR